MCVGWFQDEQNLPSWLVTRLLLMREIKELETREFEIKFESFRPFAPSVLEEKSEQYFDLNVPSPYMLLVAPLLRDIPAVAYR